MQSGFLCGHYRVCVPIQPDNQIFGCFHSPDVLTFDFRIEKNGRRERSCTSQFRFTQYNTMVCIVFLSTQLIFTLFPIFFVSTCQWCWLSEWIMSSYGTQCCVVTGFRGLFGSDIKLQMLDCHLLAFLPYELACSIWNVFPQNKNASHFYSRNS